MLLLENQTTSDVEIKDIGITIPASTTYDVLSKGRDRVATSDSILNYIVDGTLKLVQDNLSTPMTYYPTAEAIRILTGAAMSLAKNDKGELITNMESMHSEVGSKKLWVHSSPKPEVEGKQFLVQYTGVGDMGNDTGAGSPTILDIQANEAEKEVILHFDNTEMNCDVYIHNANFIWENAGFGDSFSIEMHAGPTSLQTLVNKDLELVNFGAGNFIKFATGGPGTGTHGFAANPVLIKSLKKTGYWDYNSMSGLVPNLTQEGGFNISDVDINVVKYVNNVPVYGTNLSYTTLSSYDTAWIPPGYNMRLKCYNVSGNHWKLLMYMTMFREKTF
jgi:hypothetical protein